MLSESVIKYSQLIVNNCSYFSIHYIIYNNTLYSTISH